MPPSFHSEYSHSNSSNFSPVAPLSLSALRREQFDRSSAGLHECFRRQCQLCNRSPTTYLQKEMLTGQQMDTILLISDFHEFDYFYLFFLKTEFRRVRERVHAERWKLLFIIQITVGCAMMKCFGGSRCPRWKSLPTFNRQLDSSNVVTSLFR